MQVGFNVFKKAALPKFGHSESTDPKSSKDSLLQNLDTFFSIEDKLKMAPSRDRRDLMRQYNRDNLLPPLLQKFQETPHLVTPEDLTLFNNSQVPSTKLILGNFYPQQSSLDQALLKNFPHLEVLIHQLKQAVRLPLDTPAFVGRVSLKPPSDDTYFRQVIDDTYPDPENLIKTQLQFATEAQRRKHFGMPPMTNAEFTYHVKHSDGDGAKAAAQRWMDQVFSFQPPEKQQGIITTLKNNLARAYRIHETRRTRKMAKKLDFQPQIPDQVQVIKLMGNVSPSLRLMQSLSKNPFKGGLAFVDGMIFLKPEQTFSEEGRFNVGGLIDQAQTTISREKNQNPYEKRWGKDLHN